MEKRPAREAADLFDLTGKVALVTGGSRGMGRAMVQGFAAAGADVAVVSRHIEACERVAKEVESTTGRRAIPFACHMGHWEDIDRLVDGVYEKFGCLDVLVNNAGMSPTYPDPASVTEELFDKVIAVNLKGPFRLTALVGTRMVAAGGGVILMITSHNVVQPDPQAIPYSAAKAGLQSMTVAFARDLGPSVRVNAIQPGAFLTDVSKAWDMGAVENYVSTFALSRLADPQEIVGTAVYLASDASAYVTGAVVRLDGGAP